MQLPSRQFQSADDFVESFFSTLTPGVIKRSDFVRWDNIYEKLDILSSATDFLSDLRLRRSAEGSLTEEMVNSLLSADDPQPYIKGAFEILGHTSKAVAAIEDDININAVAKQIQSGDETMSREVTDLIFALGLNHVLLRGNLEDVLFGVQVGLESHRRKNSGGSAFRDAVKMILVDVAKQLDTDLSWCIRFC